MEVKQAEVFLAVAEGLHFGRAAEELRMAQPAVSRRIAALERELGVALFQRDTRNVVLSPAGEALLQPARELLRIADDARLAVRAAGRGEVGRVRVAYAGVSTDFMVGLLAQRVRRSHPGIVLDLFSGSFGDEKVEMVARGDADLCLGRWEHTPAAVTTRTIAREQLMAAVPADHPLADAGAITMSQLRSEVFVALQPHVGMVIATRLQELCRGAGFDAQIVQYAPDNWTLLTLVGAGIGCAVTVSPVADHVQLPHVRFLRVIDPARPIELRMAWQSGTRRRPAVRRVLALAEELWLQPK